MNVAARPVCAAAKRILAIASFVAVLVAGGCGSASKQTVGPPTKLAFTTQPGSTAAGSAMSSVVVSVEDANGHVVTTSTDMITVAIQANPGAGTLSGTATVAAVAGMATFSGLSINNAGTAYTLQATDATTATITSATSSVFNIFGVAAKLAFTAQPSGGTGGTAWAAQPAVTVEDANGIPVANSSASITLAITAATGTAGATLTCTTNPLAASSGVAAFAACKIDKVGAGYTLTATANGLTSATSNPFNITAGAAAKLAFTTQPGGGTGGTAWAQQAAVTVEDAGGNTVTASSASITLAITAGTGTTGAALTCTSNPFAASSGVATFAGCKINLAGIGYTLTATSNGLTSATSGVFNITVGVAAQLAFTAQTGGGTGGTVWALQPALSVEDAGGNIVTGSSTSITLAITGGTGTVGAALTCTTNPVTAAAGIAVFVGCKIDKTGNGYTLTASGGGFTSAPSTAFNITAGGATKLAFTTQPGGGTGGTAWATQAVVTVQDAGGNTVTASSASITLAITGGTGTGGAALTCTSNPLAASSGVATFAGCKINLAGNGYTLTATATGLAGTSNAFNVTVGAAAQLLFTNQPNGGASASLWTQQPVVTVEDAGGNLVTGSTLSITLAITGGTGTGGAALTCTNNPLAASSGVATFVGCQINLSGNGYTLTATGGGFTSPASSAFNINAGPASQLQFVVQPVTTPENTSISPSIQVAVKDAQGNTVTSSGISITLAISTNPSSGTLACSNNTVAAVSGVATFAGCQINAVGNGYALTATGGGFTSPASNVFNVTLQLGPASKIVITTNPNGGTGGIAWTSQPIVTVEDSNGNTETGSTISITLAITGGTGTGGAALACSNNTVAAVAGIATFSGCEINLIGSGYTLTATGGGFTSAASPGFNITLGAASQLGFTTEPGGGASSTTWSQQPVVTVEDAGGNTETGSTTSITLSITGSPAGDTLSCTSNTVAAIAGVATFAGCSINNNGTYTLTATGGALNGTSASFNIGTSLPASCAGAPSGNEYLVTGHWAALVQGWQGSGTGLPAAMLFALSAHGDGTLDNLSAGTSGDLDEQLGANGASSHAHLSIEQSGSSYVIGPDPHVVGFVGCMTLVTSAATTIHFRFALGGVTGIGAAARASTGRVIKWDDTTGSGVRVEGVMLPQTSSNFALNQLHTSYAFGEEGGDNTGGHVGAAGSISLNTTTGAFSGELDTDDAGTGGETTETGTIGAISNLTGRGTLQSTLSGSVTVSNSAIYVVNSNEILTINTDEFSTGVIISGRAIVTGHGNFTNSTVSGNLVIHLTGTATVAGGDACQNNTVSCADANLVFGIATPTGVGNTGSFAGTSWEYKLGNTLVGKPLTGATYTVDTTWGRLSLSGAGVDQAPVFYLATPQTNTESYVGFGAGSGTTTIDPDAVSGFVEQGLSSSITTSSLAGQYFFGVENPGDNNVQDELGVISVNSGGVITGTQFGSGTDGLETQDLSGANGGTIAIDNANGPGTGNVGPGTVAIATGKTFVFIDSGSNANGVAGTSDAKINVGNE